jgi:hypothetical protein
MNSDASDPVTGRTEPFATPPKAHRPTFEIDKRHLWITAPVLVAFLTALGTIIVSSTQQYATTLLERNKFEYTLIAKALAAPSQPDAAKELLFFRKVGLLKGLNEDEIGKAATGKEVEQLPVFHGAAFRDGTINYSQAKAVLKALDFYNGPIDNTYDLDFQVSILRFQRAKNIKVDGLTGGETVLSMWEACPSCPDLLRGHQSLNSIGPSAK